MTEQERKHRTFAGHHSNLAVQSLRKENEELRNELESLRCQLESQTRVDPKQVNGDVVNTETTLITPAQASGMSVLLLVKFVNLLCNICSCWSV